MDSSGESSTFFDPISLEEVSTNLAIKIKNETFNIQTLLDWMANDTDFGIQYSSVGYCKNRDFINPATAKAFTEQEVKNIYEIGKAKGLLFNSYPYFFKAKDRKKFLRDEIAGLNGNLADEKAILAKEYLIGLQKHVEFLEVEVPLADQMKKSGEKITRNKTKITKAITRFNSEFQEVECSAEQDTLKKQLIERMDKMLNIRHSWSLK